MTRRSSLRRGVAALVTTCLVLQPAAVPTFAADFTIISPADAAAQTGNS